MNNIKKFFKLNPFSINKKNKNKMLVNIMMNLNIHHIKNCKEYSDILNFFNYNKKKRYAINELPFLPVRIFKSNKLFSVKEKDIVNRLTSSGTSGQDLSKIFLDKENSLNQTKVLSNIISDCIGNKRLPMLFIDSKNILKNNSQYSARIAAILGFSIFGSKNYFALNDDMSLNYKLVDDFYKKYKNQKYIIFGFTFLVWENFYKALLKSKKKYNLSGGIIIHGGGWKKLSNLNIDNNYFKNSIKKLTKIKSIINYYGMIEQSGSIFTECKYGYLHCSNYSDIIVRDPKTFEPLPFKKIGVVQLLSILPTSYPGHNILTEDIGKIIGEDSCKCDKKGKYFLILGRIKSAELRGCSDV